MATNQALLKADITLADLASNGGKLQAQEAQGFIRKLIVAPTLLRQVRVVEMLSSERKVNKIGFGTRILRKATQNVALTSAQRSKPTTSQITMTTQEVIAEVRLPYDVVEDNIERVQAATNSASNQAQMGGIKDLIISMMAERAALDLEELALLSDTAFTDGASADNQAYLSMFDGYLKIANTLGNVVNRSSAAIDKTLFKAGVKAMPDAYLRQRTLMRHFVSYDQETEYQDTLANRATTLGDSNVVQAPQLYAYGAKVEGVALMPESKGLFVDPMNLLFGIQRQISLEYDKDITTRVYIIVLTARVAVGIEEPEAMVAYKNIG
jgi:hypothetical protein